MKEQKDKFERGLLTREFFVRAKTSSIPLRKLAAAVGLNACIFSGYLHNSRPVRHADARLIEIGRLLGLHPHECFEPIAAGAFQSNDRESEVVVVE